MRGHTLVAPAPRAAARWRRPIADASRLGAPFMIGLVAHDRARAIELLDEDEAREIVRHRKRGETHAPVRLTQEIVAQAVRSADHEREAGVRLRRRALQERGEAVGA